MVRGRWSGRRRALGRWTVRLVEVVSGVWVASVLVSGLTLPLWPDAVLVAAAFLAALTLVEWALRPLKRALWTFTGWIDERGLDGREWQFHLMGAVSIVWWLAGLAAAGALRVAVLWLVIQAFGAVGLSSRLEGFWPSVTATVVLSAGAGVVGWLRSLALAALVRRRRGRLSWASAEFPLTAVALGVGVLLLPGVELPGGPGPGTQLLALGVLAMAVTVVRLEVTVSFLVLLSTFAVNGLKLWLVGMVGAWLTVPLRIDGLLSYGALALLVTALSWPAVRVRRRRQAQREALAAMEQHQGMMHAMHTAQQSMWGIR
jgi:hypothetical protein